MRDEGTREELLAKVRQAALANWNITEESARNAREMLARHRERQRQRRQARQQGRSIRRRRGE